jgi:hypothetical protein
MEEEWKQKREKSVINEGDRQRKKIGNKKTIND